MAITFLYEVKSPTMTKYGNFKLFCHKGGHSFYARKVNKM